MYCSPYIRYILSVRIYWFTFCVIPTYSMSPTLLGGDYILASLQIPGRRIIEEDESRDERKLVHRLEGIRQVRKNDVVVFNYPYSEDKEKMILSAKLFFCKRCVALPGDTYQWFARESLEKVYLPKVEIYCQLIPVTTTTTDTV
ncbi:MAG: signal peptidase I [Bacteroides cellulosilyticus]